MNGFTAAAQEAVAVWTVTREGDPTFPRAYFSEAAADAMVAHITLAPFAVKRAPVAAAPVDLHVDCRQCARCNHAGINDNSDQLAACLSCEWSGNSPDEDHCPECDKTGCMGAACPKCGARYTLIAEAELKVSATEAPEIDEAKLREALRKARIQQLYVFENSEIDSLVRELCDTSVAKVGIDACTWAGDGEGNWHTACGEIFTLMEGSPADNKMHHCPYCGKNLMTTGTDVCVAVIGDSYEDTRSEAHDAARYRWLRNHYEPSFHDSECDSLIGLHGEDLDDAIDDEMQATSAEVGA